MKFYLIAAILSLGVAGAAHANCPRGTVSRGEVSGRSICAFAQKKYLNEDIVLTNDNVYLLEQGTYFGADMANASTLRVQPGVKVMANSGAFLVIMRGSKIFAVGSEKDPIVFTTSKTIGRKRGEWGGLVINGMAPINACAGKQPVCEAISEGIKEEQVKFGGGNPADSSGELRYVRVEFGGYPIAPDNELNGITFNGVGSGTKVDYIQVHMNADDGVEFFGGNVDVRHLVLTGNDDDALDWDFGWRGRAQYVLIKQADDIADNGFEGDNLKSPMNSEPRSNPTLANVTMIGGAKSGYGMLLRSGTAAHIVNLVATGFSKGCIDIDAEETFRFNGIKLENSALACAKNFEIEQGDLFDLSKWFSQQSGNLELDGKNTGLLGHVPAPSSPLLGRGKILDDIFFEPADFIGAVASDDEDWSKGWTTSDLQ